MLISKPSLLLPVVVGCCSSTDRPPELKRSGTGGGPVTRSNSQLFGNGTPGRCFAVPSVRRRCSVFSKHNFTMVSAGIVASCLALLAPARGFVRPIVTRTPGAEVRVLSCHTPALSGCVCLIRSTERVWEMRVMNVVSSWSLMGSEQQNQLANIPF